MFFSSYLCRLKLLPAHQCTIPNYFNPSYFILKGEEEDSLHYKMDDAELKRFFGTTVLSEGIFFKCYTLSAY